MGPGLVLSSLGALDSFSFFLAVWILIFTLKGLIAL